MSQVFLPYRIPFPTELVQHSGHVNRVPGHHCVGEKIKATGLVVLFLFLFPPHRAAVSEEQETSQCVECLSLVKLGDGTAPDLVVPFYVNALTNSSSYNLRIGAIASLEMLGEDAKPAVAQLMATLQDPDSRVRFYATNALIAIDPDAAMDAGITAPPE